MNIIHADGVELYITHMEYKMCRVAMIIARDGHELRTSM